MDFLSHHSSLQSWLRKKENRLKVLVPDSIHLDLPASDQDIDYITYSVTSTDFTSVQDAELLVLWLNTPENISAAVSQLKNLKAVQSLAAGPDHLYEAGFAPHISLASGRGLHDAPVAEHALSLILATVRNLDGLQRSQKNKHWDRETIAAQAAVDTYQMFTLNGSAVLIIGFGSIASHLAPMLTALGASVSGVAQSNGERDGYPVVAHSEMSVPLSKADLVLSLVPYTPETEKIFDQHFFKGMKQSAIFINVGRGKTVDEEALLQALSEKIIRKAAVDVTFVEPLPAASPLWELQNLVITPHISGGRPQNSSHLIALNAERILNGQEVLNKVNR
jgi:phosphoglycerate dehydrogenase-like enzyme